MLLNITEHGLCPPKYENSCTICMALERLEKHLKDEFKLDLTIKRKCEGW